MEEKFECEKFELEQFIKACRLRCNKHIRYWIARKGYSLESYCSEAFLENSKENWYAITDSEIKEAEEEQFRAACHFMHLNHIKYWIEIKGYSVNLIFKAYYDIEIELGEDNWTPIHLTTHYYANKLHRNWCLPYLLSKGADLSIHPKGYDIVKNMIDNIMYVPVNALPLLIQHGCTLPEETFSTLLQYNVPDLLDLIAPCYTKKMFHCSILSGYYGTKYVEECINHLSSHDHNPYAHGLTFLQFACYFFANEYHVEDEEEREYENYKERDRYERTFYHTEEEEAGDSYPDEPPRHEVSTYSHITLHDEFLPKRIEIMVKTHGIRPIHDKKIDPLLIILQSGRSCSIVENILWNNGYKEYSEQTPEFKQLVQEVSHTK